MLLANPRAGRRRPELGGELRSFPVGNYIVFYAPTRDGIEVLRVLEGHQNISADDMD